MVSRLDRLSRNVHFITGLTEHKVHFVVAAVNRLRILIRDFGHRARRYNELRRRSASN